MRTIIILIFLGLGLFLFYFYQSGHRDITREKILMGNVPVILTLKIDPKQSEKAIKDMDAAFNVAREQEAIFSHYQPDSELSVLLNKPYGQAYSVSKNLYDVLVKANEVSTMTNGLFDVTFASNDKNISFRDIDLSVPNQVILKKENMKIDLSAIAKGYIVDVVADFLKDRGYSSLLVDAGGDLLALGHWNIGIQNPSGRGVICEVDLENKAVATSGTYERGNHIKVPQSARDKSNQETAAQSISVAADHAWRADAWATAIYLLDENTLFLPSKDDVQIDWLIVGHKDILIQGSTFKDCVQ